MLKHYREIFYGLLFGVGAAIIDIFTDAKMQNKSFWDVSPGMLLYRVLFVAFGLVLGWLLWRKNQREREFRHLRAAYEKLRQDVGAPSVVIHAQAQLLLARPNSPLPPDVEMVVRSIYEQSQKLQSLTKERAAELQMEATDPKSEAAPQ